MGLSFFYVNHDKTQFFSCGLFDCNDRFSALGKSHGARALAILLYHGTWRGDRISVISDGGDEFDQMYALGTDIQIEVELMMMDFEGLETLDIISDHHSAAFDRICAYALFLRRADAMSLLDTKFGKGKWQHHYQRHLQGNTDLLTQKVMDAQNRNLKIFGAISKSADGN